MVVTDTPTENGGAASFNGDPSGEGGFIIVAVMWILAALAALVVAYSIFVTNTVAVIAGTADRVENEAAVSSAIEMTCYQLLSQDEKARPTSGRFDGRIGTAKISTVYVSEAARIDLNLASKEFLAGLLVGLGVNDDQANDLADRIVGWRKPMTAAKADDDPENMIYLNAGLNYLPRHAPFPHVDELRLVNGMSQLFANAMLPFVTVYSGRSSINIRDAAPQTVAALPNMTPEKLQGILTARESDQVDPSSLIALTGLGEDLVTTEGSKAVRMAIDVEFKNGRRINSDAVVLLLKDGVEPYRLLSRHDNIEGNPSSRTQRNYVK
jgi:general secretion pathway protein K